MNPTATATRAADDRTAGELMRLAVGRLPRLAGVAPPGFAAFARAAVVADGLDAAVVSEWAIERGGYEGVTYLHAPARGPAAHGCRAPLTPLPFVAVPLGVVGPVASVVRSG